MSLSINPNARKLQVPGIRKFANRIPEFPGTINLTVGQPDFETPESVKQAFIQAVTDNHTTYSHNQGLLPLRQAVSDYMLDKYKAEYNADQILITNGASEAIDTVLRTILEPGDEVILPGPIYAGYIPIIENMGAAPIIIDTTPYQCKVTAELIAQAVTAQTKAVLLNYPNNPTGAVLTAGETAELAHFLSKQSFYTISDEIYAENTFEGVHTSFGRFEQLKDRLILINGLSKSHSMTGFRIGFCMGPDELMNHVTIVHAYNCICANVPAQYAALNAVTTAKDAAFEMNTAYKMRRALCIKRLNDIGLKYIHPDGAFYLFIDIKSFQMTSLEFAVLALEQYGIAVVPGSTFTSAGEGYIRISYAYHEDVLTEGFNRLERMINDIK